MKTLLILASGLTLVLTALCGAPRAFAAADFYVAGYGPGTLQAGMSGTYSVTVSNFGDVSPVELIIIFAGKLEQTGQISAGGGFDCVVRPPEAGINSAVRCTVQQLANFPVHKIVVQGRGLAPGAGQFIVTINPDHSVPEDNFANNFYQQNVNIT